MGVAFASGGGGLTSTRTTISPKSAPSDTMPHRVRLVGLRTKRCCCAPLSSAGSPLAFAGLSATLSPFNSEVEQFRQFPITRTGNERQSREIAP